MCCQREKQSNAAIRIQTNYRGHIARVEYNRMKLARHTKVQKEVHVQEPQKEASQAKEIEAAIVVQAVFRGYSTRKSVKKHRETTELAQSTMINSKVIKIQSSWRAYVARRRAKEMRKQQAKEEMIQNDSFNEIEQKQKQIEAATKLQALVRGRIARRNLAKKDVDIQVDGIADKRESAAVSIQSFWRGSRARKQVKAIRKEQTDENKSEKQDESESESKKNEKEWIPYYDEGSGHYYYYNPRTQEARWEAPEGSGYETAPAELESGYDSVWDTNPTTDYMSDGYAYTGMSHAANPGMMMPTEAMMSMAVAMAIQAHAAVAIAQSAQSGYNQSLALPPQLPVAPEGVFPPSSYPVCVECESLYATRSCHQCGDPYCDECFIHVHGKGRKADHTYEVLGEEGTSENEWIQCYDEDSQQYYYYNTITQESTWM